MSRVMAAAGQPRRLIFASHIMSTTALTFRRAEKLHGSHSFVRLSVQAYNTRADLDLLVSALAQAGV